MPKWLTPTLQWGGVALAILAAIALVSVLGNAEPPAGGEAVVDEVTAPVILYWVLLVVGVVGAIVGFMMGRRRPTGGGQR